MQFWIRICISDCWEAFKEDKKILQMGLKTIDIRKYVENRPQMELLISICIYLIYGNLYYYLYYIQNKL